MANLCENEIRVYGDFDELQKFKEFARNGEQVLDVEKFKPANPEGSDAVGLRWREYHSLDIVIEPSVLIYATHITCWDPAIGIVRQMSRMFPRLFFSLTYWSYESGYIGFYKIWNGKTIKSGYKEDFFEWDAGFRKEFEKEIEEDFEILDVLPIAGMKTRKEKRLRALHLKYWALGNELVSECNEIHEKINIDTSGLGSIRKWRYVPINEV